MNRRLTILAALAFVVGAAVSGWWAWKRDEPRRQCLARLERFEQALRTADRAGLLEMVVIPTAIQNRTVPEQTEFLTKALADEISTAGLAVLKKRGKYGPLKEVFPEEAEAWAKAGAARPEECVAFKMERNGLRAEVVLVRLSTEASSSPAGEASYRIVRVNNVKQMAEANLSTPKD